MTAQEIYVHARKYCLQEARVYRRTQPALANQKVCEAREWSRKVVVASKCARYAK